MFQNLQQGSFNKDIGNLQYAFNYYYGLTVNWNDPLPPPVIKNIDGYNIIDESELGDIGSKGRFGDLLFQTIKEKTVVYCQPRFGWAGISLCYLAKKYDKRLVLFMPAAKEASVHQLVTIEKGAIPIFKRIAAMPNLNKAAKEWAERNKAFFIPLGLKHPLVTAAIVRVAYDLFKNKNQPERMWSVISTGVLTRGLQIALPNTEFTAIAVARNIQQGELGRANFMGYPRPFPWKLKESPIAEIPSALNYDAKGLDFLTLFGNSGTYFWNVAGEIQPKYIKASEVKSDMPW